MTEEEKRQLVTDILKRDKLTGASIPLYQIIPQLSSYFLRVGVSGHRDCLKRFNQLKNHIVFKGKTVLDLGCDNGMMMRYAAGVGAKLTVGVESPLVHDEAERVAKLTGNNKAKFVRLDLKTVTTDGLQRSTGQEQFDVVFYLAMDSFFGQFPSYLSAITKKTLVYEKLVDSVPLGRVIDWLKTQGFKKVINIGGVADTYPDAMIDQGNQVLIATK